MPISTVQLLADDLNDMYSDEDYDSEPACYREWLRRLGGTQNIAAYASTQVARAAGRTPAHGGTWPRTGHAS